MAQGTLLMKQMPPLPHKFTVTSTDKFNDMTIVKLFKKQGEKFRFSKKNIKDYEVFRIHGEPGTEFFCLPNGHLAQIKRRNK